jgi:hypothetical protein
VAVLGAATVWIAAFTLLGGGVESSQNLSANAFSRRISPITHHFPLVTNSLQDYSPNVAKAPPISFREILSLR